MRYLKRQSTNKRLLNGKGLIYTQYEDIEAQSVGAFLVPKGTSAQRPSSPSEGQVRYNTTNRQLEVYEFNSGTSQVEWKTFRLSEPQNITLQNLGNGDATITLFGPLDSQDPNTIYTAPAAAQNVLVFVENVFQISTTNYTLIQNPSSTGTGQEVESGNFVIGEEYIITATGVTDYVSEHGAADNNPGTTFTAASAGTADATGLARLTGYYLEFTSAVDLNKPVTVLHNFDK